GGVVELAVVHRLVVVLRQMQDELFGGVCARLGVRGDDVVVEHVHVGPAVAPGAGQRPGEEHVLGDVRFGALGGAVGGDGVDDVGCLAGDQVLVVGCRVPGKDGRRHGAVVQVHHVFHRIDGAIP